MAKSLFPKEVPSLIDGKPQQVWRGALELQKRLLRLEGPRRNRPRMKFLSYPLFALDFPPFPFVRYREQAIWVDVAVGATSTSDQEPSLLLRYRIYCIRRDVANGAILLGFGRHYHYIAVGVGKSALRKFFRIGILIR